MADHQFENELAPEIHEFSAVMRSAVRAAGGFGLVMRSELDKDVRTREIKPLLASLGIFDLVPDRDENQLQAAAAACRTAGSFALPYPVAERLAGNTLDGLDLERSGSAPTALAVVGERGVDRARVNMGDLPFDWWAVETSTGQLIPAHSPDVAGFGGRLAPFVTDRALGEDGPVVSDTLALAMHLQSFTLLGMLESALELTRGHTNDRVQFEAPIITYQAVQHQLADALITIRMFEQQALYALWSLERHRASVLVDVVGARLAGLRAADTVLRVGHQLHGASGFCDESAISWISRHSQSLRRLPLNRDQTERWFTALVLRCGLDGLFSATVADAPQAVTDGHARTPSEQRDPFVAEQGDR